MRTITPPLRRLAPLTLAVSLLTGCATALHSSYSDKDKQNYPKASADADTVVSLISDKDKTRFSIDGKPVDGEVQAGGELRVLVNRQSHDIVAQAAGFRPKPQHVQPPYNEHSPISFSFIYTEALAYGGGTGDSFPEPISMPGASPPLPDNNIPLATESELPVPTDTSGFGRYVALIIANERYQHTKELKTPIDDAEAIKTVLEQRYGFQTTLIRDATRHDILGALADLQKQVDSNTNVLVFYAGHGNFVEQENRGYWLPVDAELDNPANWIANDDITSRVKAMEAKHVLVVADSCYSGAMMRGGDFRGFGAVKSGEVAASDAGPYLARLAHKKMRRAMTSGGLEPVLDKGGNGNHSVFASAVVSVLQDADGVMEGTLLFSRVRQKVASNADQIPEYGIIKYAGDDGGDFLFIPAKRP